MFNSPKKLFHSTFFTSNPCSAAIKWGISALMIFCLVFSAQVMGQTKPLTRIANFLGKQGELTVPVGYRGTLDARGYELIEQADTPRFAAVDSAKFSLNRATGGEWRTFGGVRGCNGTVNASAPMSNGDLIVVGRFTACGDVPANGVARWNGTTWSSLGSGANNGTKDGTVLAVAVSAGDIYIGGSFRTVAEIPVNGVARWNGSSWSSLGTGVAATAVPFVGTVRKIATVGNDVFVSGTFDSAGGTPAKNLAL